MRLAFHWQVAGALVLAAVVGAFSAPQDPWLPALDLIGTLFLNALKLLALPLIVSAIISGLAALQGQAVGRLGLLTVFYYASTSLFAVLTGVLFMNLLTPGLVDGAPAGPLMGLSERTGEVVQVMEGRGLGDLKEVLLLLVPPNIFAAAADGQILGLIVFSLLFGYFLTRMPGELARGQGEFWRSFYEVMLRITQAVMRLAPVGVFALVAEAIAQTGWSAVRPLGAFFLTVLLALTAHSLLTLPLVLRLVARVSPLLHFRAMGPALVTAFSTSSSAATLPVTLECVEDRARVPRRVSGLVLPIGSTVNMDGTALYECVVALFIAQAYGVELGLVGQLVVVLTAVLTSIGVAGIPSASLVAIAVVLGAVGLPLEGIGLVLAVDRILDMCRTTVNVFSDSCGAVVVGRLTGEDGILGEPALRR